MYVIYHKILILSNKLSLSINFCTIKITFLIALGFITNYLLVLLILKENINNNNFLHEFIFQIFAVFYIFNN